MEDFPLLRVTIPGSTLASLLHRCSAAPGDTDGLLFGRVSLITPSSLSDDRHSTSSSSSSPSFHASVTNFFSFGTTSSFYDSSGNIDVASLRRLLHLSPSHRLLGWFSTRRRSPLRPSLREFSISHSLSSKSEFASPIDNSSRSFSPSIFLLLTTPFPDPQTLIHTHDYRAYQFMASAGAFEAKPVDLINIGPGFRGHYGNFHPNSELPFLSCNVSKGSLMRVDSKGSDSLSYMKNVSLDQDKMDLYAEGYGVGNLKKLLGSKYASSLEDLYEDMLAKLNSLARSVEASNAKVQEQEDRNTRLRYKVAGVE